MIELFVHHFNFGSEGTHEIDDVIRYINELGRDRATIRIKDKSYNRIVEAVTGAAYEQHITHIYYRIRFEDDADALTFKLLFDLRYSKEMSKSHDGYPYAMEDVGRTTVRV